MRKIDYLVSWYFVKMPKIINHIFVPIDHKDPYKEASEIIKKRYRCNDLDFNVLCIQEAVRC